MNYRMMSRFISLILLVEVIFMLPALALALWDHNMVVALAFLEGMGATLLVSVILHAFSRKARKGFFAKEGLVCVAISWIVMSLLGCLPFFLSGEIPNYVDALLRLYPASPLPALQFCRKWRTTPCGSLLEKLQSLAGRYGRSGISACDRPFRRSCWRLYYAPAPC